MSIKGLTIVFTGKISRPRHEFETLVEENGGHFGTSVSKNTDLLVVGEKPGSKLVVASLLGVKTVNEEEFLKLLTTELLDEEPLSREALEELARHTVTLTCKWCERSYVQWDDLPKYYTCPICEIYADVRCPHCDNEAMFVKDLNLYSCTCGEWFAAPYSSRARSIEHLHMWIKSTGNSKECVCGYKIRGPFDEEYNRYKYQMYPTWIKQWREQRNTLERQRQVESNFRAWFDGLADVERQAFIQEFDKTFPKVREYKEEIT